MAKPEGAQILRTKRSVDLPNRRRKFTKNLPMIYESRGRAEAILILSCKELVPSVWPETIWSKAGLKVGASMSILVGQRISEPARNFSGSWRSPVTKRSNEEKASEIHKP